MACDELAPFVIQNVEGLNETKEAGHGAYGQVHKVTVNGLPCIAKRLHKALVTGVSVNGCETIKRKFRSECITLSKLKHPNIVHFVGVHYGVDRNDLTLIMECLQSDLADFLEAHPNTALSLKLSILLDVTYGLLYLHTHHPPVVHRDLTARNILVTFDGVGKIADVGVAKFLNPPQLQLANAANYKHTTAPGQPMYMPPEVLKENAECTPKIDIFSFGHLALYTVNEEAPKVMDDKYVTPPAQQLGRSQIMKRQEALGKVGQKHCMYALILLCLRDNPTQRPNTEELNGKMKELSTKHPKRVEDLLHVSNVFATIEKEKETLRKRLDEVTREKLVMSERLRELEQEKEHLKQVVIDKQADIDNCKTIKKTQARATELATELVTVLMAAPSPAQLHMAQPNQPQPHFRPPPLPARAYSVDDPGLRHNQRGVGITPTVQGSSSCLPFLQGNVYPVYYPEKQFDKHQGPTTPDGSRNMAENTLDGWNLPPPIIPDEKTTFQYPAAPAESQYQLNADNTQKAMYATILPRSNAPPPVSTAAAPYIYYDGGGHATEHAQKYYGGGDVHVPATEYAQIYQNIRPLMSDSPSGPSSLPSILSSTDHYQNQMNQQHEPNIRVFASDGETGDAIERDYSPPTSLGAYDRTGSSGPSSLNPLIPQAQPRMSNQPSPKVGGIGQHEGFSGGHQEDILHLQQLQLHHQMESQEVSSDAPYDPNLVCPTCKARFRIGEIQKFRRHGASCSKK